MDQARRQQAGRRPNPFWVGALAGAILLAAAAPAAAKTADVDATGNPITGGLGYDPAAIEVGVGDTVRWTNTDFFAPHTATEDHGLWDLAGDYGISAIAPTGFGPGESVERRFEAGAWSYYCRVHGKEAQSGTVDVPVALAARRSGGDKGKPRYVITARWSRTGPAEGQVFDVQMRRASAGPSASLDSGGTSAGPAAQSGSWRLVRDGTGKRSMRLGGRRAGTVLEFRARVRSAEDRAAASGWSPPAKVRAG